MPHDANGQLLEVGDTVVIECTVESVTQEEGYCNVTLKSKYGRKPDGSKETYCTNAAVVIKVEPEDEDEPAAEGASDPVTTS